MQSRMQSRMQAPAGSSAKPNRSDSLSGIGFPNWSTSLTQMVHGSPATTRSRPLPLIVVSSRAGSEGSSSSRKGDPIT